MNQSFWDPILRRINERLQTPEQAEELVLDLLRGAFSFGVLDQLPLWERLEPAVQQLSPENRLRLDQAFFPSLENLLPSTRYRATQKAALLRDGFLCLRMFEFQDSLQRAKHKLPEWQPLLRQAYVGPSHDPEFEFLFALTLAQEKQELLPLWRRLCRLSDPWPHFQYTRIGLQGLMLLPQEDGTPYQDIPPQLYPGLVAMARAIDGFGQGSEKAKSSFWLGCVGLMTQGFPRSEEDWTKRLWPHLGLDKKEAETAVRWLSPRLPGLEQKVKKGTYGKGVLSPPGPEETKQIKRQIQSKTWSPALVKNFAHKHLQYAALTGDVDYLDRSFCNLAEDLIPTDPDLAIELLETAREWAPFDPYVWSELAKARFAKQEEVVALSLLWKARRRFPGHESFSTQLGRHFQDRSPLLGELLYQEAVRLYPNNHHNLNALADLKLSQGRPAQAVELLEQGLRLADRAREAAQQQTSGESQKKEQRLSRALAVSYNLLGRAKIQLQDWAGAVTALKQSLDCSPDEASYKQLTHLYLQLAQEPEAKECFDQWQAWSKGAGNWEGFKQGHKQRHKSEQIHREQPDLQAALGDPALCRPLWEEVRAQTEEGQLQLVGLLLSFSGRLGIALSPELQTGMAQLLESTTKNAPEQLATQVQLGRFYYHRSKEEALDFFTRKKLQYQKVMAFDLEQARIRRELEGKVMNLGELRKDYSLFALPLNLEYVLQEVSAIGSQAPSPELLGSLQKLFHLATDAAEPNLSDSLAEQEKWARELLKGCLFKETAKDIKFTPGNWQPVQRNIEQNSQLLRQVRNYLVESVL